MRRLHTSVLLLILACGVACSSGGGSGIDDPSTTIVGSFETDTPTPGTNSVSMSQGGATANLVTVSLRVTDVNDIYGAGFDVLFDPTQVTFDSTQPGTILQSGGHTPILLTSQPQSGHLVVSLTRQNGAGVGGVNVSGTQTLLSLRMRVTEVGTSSVSFERARLFDSAVQPQEIPGTTWSGGALVGR